MLGRGGVKWKGESGDGGDNEAAARDRVRAIGKSVTHDEAPLASDVCGGDRRSNCGRPGLVTWFGTRGRRAECRDLPETGRDL